MLCRYIWLLFWNAMVLLTVTFHLERLSQFHIWKLDLITSRTVWAQEESFGKSNIQYTPRYGQPFRCLFSVNWWRIWEHVSLLILGNEIHRCGWTALKLLCSNAACPDTQELNRISLYHTYCMTFEWKSSLKVLKAQKHMHYSLHCKLCMPFTIKK